MRWIPESTNNRRKVPIDGSRRESIGCCCSTMLNLTEAMMALWGSSVIEGFDYFLIDRIPNLLTNGEVEELKSRSLVIISSGLINASLPRHSATTFLVPSSEDSAYLNNSGNTAAWYSWNALTFSWESECLEMISLREWRRRYCLLGCCSIS